MNVRTIVNVPQVKDLQAAVELYYKQTEIGRKDIMTIFGCSGGTATRLKKRAREQMDADGVASYNAQLVNTESAFKSWGLDVKRMERALGKPVLRLCGGQAQ